jgi:uncharacterized protein (TIGR03437 family)
MCHSFANRTARIGSLAVLASLFSFGLYAQTTSCTSSSTAVLAHQEGLAERVGDITLACAGGVGGSTVSTTLFVSLNTNITNRLDADGNPLGVSVTVNTGGGATPTGAVKLSGPSTILISSLNYTVPALPATTVTINVSGLRAAVASLSNGSAPAAVSATVVAPGIQLAGGSLIPVAFSTPTLLQSTLNNGVPCNGSPLPASLDFNTVASTSISSTVRVTEASVGAFTLKKAGDDSGMRILVNLTGYGTGARVFVPDAIVGNSGTTATSVGAFGNILAAGTWTPGSNQLLLIRVNGADQNGAGGALALTTPAAVTTFASVSEVSVNGGNAYAVYEVMDANPALVESAQIPAFVAVGQVNCPSPLNPALVAQLAPASSVSVATATDPLPRFVSRPPVSDCQALNDCGANYFPGLTVDTTPIALFGNSLGGRQFGFVRVGNTGPGQLTFTTSVVYDSGSNWITVSPSSGVNNVTLQVIADPASLKPGTYKASVTVDAGAYGKRVVPVTFNVGAPGVSINNIGNAASYTYGTVVPGSYAVLYGSNLSGKNVQVTFNSIPAQIVYASAGQINLIVPTNLVGQAGARIVATVDGVDSNPFTVSLAVNAPGIFDPGIVNDADTSINSAAHPAARGSLISIYLTGFSSPVSPFVTVNIGDQKGIIPSFAGEQGTYPGLDQVNVTVPVSLATTNPTVPVQVCVPGSGSAPVCSNTVNLYLK